MLKLVPIIFVLIPMLIAVTAVIWSNRRYSQFINPLTKAMRRPPGTQLGRELGREQMEIGFGLTELTVSSIVPLSVYVLFQSRLNEATPLFVLGLVLIAWGVWLAFSIAKFVDRFHRIRQLRLGYECELAVGQELDLLMLHGYRIFHDVPAENFNIDHIVVGTFGVFAVETKGRSKITSKDSEGKKQFRVIYKNGVLEFPNGPDAEAVPQAKRQAKWVSQWLSQATGSAVSATPVVVLPGWYIESKDKPDVAVIASGYIQGYFLGQKQQLLSDKEVSQIVYQIGQKVRDLAPGEVVRPLPVN